MKELKEKMNAIIVTGGKQYKVAEGDVLFIEKLDVEAGESVKFDQVLAIIDGNTHYYVRMEMTEVYLDFAADEVPEAVLLDKGDTITYTYILEGTEYPTSGILPATGFRYEE